MLFVESKLNASAEITTVEAAVASVIASNDGAVLDSVDTAVHGPVSVVDVYFSFPAIEALGDDTDEPASGYTTVLIYNED